MAGERYGTAQRVAFAGLVIASILCVTGVISPFWQEGQISVNNILNFIGKYLPVIGDITQAKFYGGIWWYCVEIDIPLQDPVKECEFYSLSTEDNSSDSVRTWVVRLASSANVVLTLVCAVVALCRTCCCGGGKTVCHGIIAFFAGACGIVALAVYVSTASEGYAMKLKFVEFSWGTYLYGVGAVITTVVSFMLCFASPNNPFTPMIVTTVGHVFPTSYVRLHESHVPMESSSRVIHVNVEHPGVQTY